MATRKSLTELENRLGRLGVGLDDTRALRRIEMTLHRWHEGECGMDNGLTSWCYVRDEETGKAYKEVHPHLAGRSYRLACPDREGGALKRLAAIMARYPDLVEYVQGDPRGCALYILRRADLADGASLDSVYTRGVAVCA